jgi:phosphonopyruvate decarboxylase
MIDGAKFVAAARERGFATWTGVPCSYLTPLMDRVADGAGARYVPASNEGEAVAIAAGCELGGARAVAMFQNSGLGNAVNPLSSLNHPHRIPVLLVVTLRGDPDGPADEPQHALMGEVTTRLLDLLQVRWEMFPERDDAIGPALDRALAHMAQSGLPFALVMRKDAAGPATKRLPAPTAPAAPAAAKSTPPAAAAHTRREFLEALVRASGERDILVSTTGYTSRELYALADRPAHFYLVGAMGCASSVGLGLALARPDLRITVLDGDGAALMRLGALAAIGLQAPPNLLHVVLDNRMHESTGGQATAAARIDLAALAANCGYPEVRRIAEPAALAEAFAAPRTRLAFAAAAVAPGTPAGLPRPTVGPADATARLRRHIAGIAVAS